MANARRIRPEFERQLMPLVERRGDPTAMAHPGTARRRGATGAAR
jgi:hypothetical protein